MKKDSIKALAGISVILGLFIFGVSSLKEDIPKETTAQVEVEVSTLSEPSLTEVVDLERVEVISVIDGDTLKVLRENGDVESVRLIGVNTPESIAPADYRVSNSEEGTAASKAVKEFFQVNNIEYIYLETDISDRDIYGRLLRYVWIEEPEKKSAAEVRSKMLNALLLSDIVYDNGQPVAEPVIYLPDKEYSKIFEEIFEETIATPPQARGMEIAFDFISCAIY